MTFQQMIEQVEDLLRRSDGGPDPFVSMAECLVGSRVTVPSATVAQVAEALASERLVSMDRSAGLHEVAVGLAARDLLPCGQVAL